MPRRLKLVLLAAVTALLVLLVVLPFVLGDRCLDAGGSFDRATLGCTLPVTEP
jgi:hypothetical protein